MASITVTRVSAMAAPPLSVWVGDVRAGEVRPSPKAPATPTASAFRRDNSMGDSCSVRGQWVATAGSWSSMTLGTWRRVMRAATATKVAKPALPSRATCMPFTKASLAAVVS